MKEADVISHLLLGSNIGDRAAYLENALAALTGRFTLVRASAVYETESWGDRSQAPYLNQAVALSVDCTAAELHAVTRSIETGMGRTGKGNFLPRTIDIDILFFGDEILRTDDLVIPHPKIRWRRFVLVPACEIAPEFVHPVLGKPLNRLLEECNDALGVELYHR